MVTDAIISNVKAAQSYKNGLGHIEEESLNCIVQQIFEIKC